MSYNKRLTVVLEDNLTLPSPLLGDPSDTTSELFIRVESPPVRLFPITLYPILSTDTVEFRMTLEEPFFVDVGVTVITEDVTALDGVHYVGINQDFTYVVGETEKIFQIQNLGVPPGETLLYNVKVIPIASGNPAVIDSIDDFSTVVLSN